MLNFVTIKYIAISHRNVEITNTLLTVIYLYRPITWIKMQIYKEFVREVGFEPTIILT